mmetsp:Transcript_33838/g.61360  ORF Transcript_33838/g.61360 Transcript_33838/m.61360 type:complete len:223 (-) Transcript_33838:1013-1681(-)
METIEKISLSLIQSHGHQRGDRQEVTCSGTLASLRELCQRNLVQASRTEEQSPRVRLKRCSTRSSSDRAAHCSCHVVSATGSFHFSASDNLDASSRRHAASSAACRTETDAERAAIADHAHRTQDSRYRRRLDSSACEPPSPELCLTGPRVATRALQTIMTRASRFCCCWALAELMAKVTAAVSCPTFAAAHQHRKVNLSIFQPRSRAFACQARAMADSFAA